MMEADIVKAVVSGLIGGVVAGVAAMAAVRVEIKWLRRDVNVLLTKVFER